MKSIHLVDLSGRTLTLSPEISGDVLKLDVSTFAVGSYLLQVETSMGSYTERIIIE
ncbi:MAG: T9SS type A sorting domain-containing protein [Cryomorphaceae bacterium]|nr:T9SS type A sorting domain-containing protein [Cryomorphaceae bacterium]